MDAKNSKGFISSFLKDKGFLTTSNKRLFVQDHGFYLIVVEIQPVRGNKGILLNVGVKFLWSTYYGISYDYSNGDIRVNVPNDPLGALFFDDPAADLIINQLMADAMERITEYQKLNDLDTFLCKIENRNDFVKIANPNFEKSDISLAIVKMFSGETSKALEILHTASSTNEVARKLLENCNNTELFQSDLINIINNCRSMMSSKLKISLDPIASLWTY